MSKQGHEPGDCVEASAVALKLGLLRTAMYVETQAESESQEGSIKAESSA